MRPLQKKSLYYFLVLMSLFFYSSTALAATSVRAVLEESNILAGGDTEITVTVSGDSASQPVAPQVKGLDIVLTGRSSSVSWINGTMSTAAEYTYDVIPSGEGSFDIPAFKVYSSGTEYASNSLRLVVGATTSSQPNQNSQNPQDLAEPAEQGDFWITSQVDQSNPYVFQEVLFRFRVYIREGAGVTDVGNLQLPAFTNFIAEELVPEQRGNEIINGQSYTTFDVVYALFPLKSGQQELPPAKLNVTYQVATSGQRPGNDPFLNDPFFRIGRFKPKQKTLTSEKVTLEVQALPEPMPANFSGLVGQFGVSASLTPSTVSAGDSATLTIDISGRGNIKDAALPNNYPQISDVRAYPSKPTLSVDKDASGLRGKKTFKIALVPENKGEVVISPLAMSYFDPQTSAYVNLQTAETHLKVRQSKQPTQTQDLTPVGPTLPDKNTPNEENKIQLPKFLNWSAIQKILFFVSAVFAALAVFSGIFWFVRKKQKATEHSRFLKSKARKSKNELLALVRKKNTSAATVLQALRRYFSAVFDCPEPYIEREVILARCQEDGVSDQEISDWRKIWEQLEAANYGGQNSACPTEAATRIQNLLK